MEMLSSNRVVGNKSLISNNLLTKIFILRIFASVYITIKLLTCLGSILINGDLKCIIYKINIIDIQELIDAQNGIEKDINSRYKSFKKKRKINVFMGNKFLCCVLLALFGYSIVASIVNRDKKNIHNMFCVSNSIYIPIIHQKCVYDETRRMAVAFSVTHRCLSLFLQCSFGLFTVRSDIEDDIKAVDTIRSHLNAMHCVSK